jgi:hypothetical protein
MKTILPLQPLNRGDCHINEASSQTKVKEQLNSHFVIGTTIATGSIEKENDAYYPQRRISTTTSSTCCSQSKALQDIDHDHNHNRDHNRDHNNDQDRHDQFDSELVRIHASSLRRNAAECKRLDTIQSSRDSSGRQFNPLHRLHLQQDRDEPLIPISNILLRQHFLKPRLLQRSTHGHDNDLSFVANVSSGIGSTKASAFISR